MNPCSETPTSLVFPLNELVFRSSYHALNAGFIADRLRTETSQFAISGMIYVQLHLPSWFGSTRLITCANATRAERSVRERSGSEMIWASSKPLPRRGTVIEASLISFA